MAALLKIACKHAVQITPHIGQEYAVSRLDRFALQVVKPVFLIIVRAAQELPTQRCAGPGQSAARCRTEAAVRVPAERHPVLPLDAHDRATVPHARIIHDDRCLLRRPQLRWEHGHVILAIGCTSSSEEERVLERRQPGAWGTRRDVLHARARLWSGGCYTGATRRTAHVPMRECVVFVYVDANPIKVVRAVVLVDTPVRVLVVVDGPTPVGSVDYRPPVIASFGCIDSLGVDGELGVDTELSPVRWRCGGGRC
eukprot:7381164-Prymnesium_polylepis.1